MADLLDDQLINAGLDLLRADTGLRVIPDADGNLPNPLPPPPYVRAYTSIERLPDFGANSLLGTSGTAVVRWWLHCVGANETAANAVAMRASRALLDARPTVAGRECGPIRHEAAQPARRDDDLGYQVIDRVDVYRMTSTPA